SGPAREEAQPPNRRPINRRLRGGYPPACRSLPEQREHGEHAPIVVLAVGQPELLEDRLDVPLDRARAEVEPLGDGAIGAALSDERENVALALGQLVEQR